MENKTKRPMNRRAGYDRRTAYKIGYFVNGGVEKRSGQDRRAQG